VSDVTIADGADIAPGETFTGTWELLNAGTCTWSKNYAISFVTGDSMDGYLTIFRHAVAPGESADVSVQLIAPDVAGSCASYWMMEDNDGASFGEQVYVQVTVTEDAATSTPTPTAIPEASPTVTPTWIATLCVTRTREDHRRHATSTPVATRRASPTPTAGGQACELCTCLLQTHRAGRRPLPDRCMQSHSYTNR
jgi:hypothetical protein